MMKFIRELQRRNVIRPSSRTGEFPMAATGRGPFPGQ